MCFGYSTEMSSVILNQIQYFRQLNCEVKLGLCQKEYCGEPTKLQI